MFVAIVVGYFCSVIASNFINVLNGELLKSLICPPFENSVNIKCLWMMSHGVFNCNTLNPIDFIEARPGLNLIKQGILSHISVSRVKSNKEHST